MNLLAIVLGAYICYIAYRYSTTTIDPDWAMFNFAAFTGSIYGKDFVDCKSPAIHIWYWLISKVVGADVSRIKFAHHTLISLPSVLIYLLTGDPWAAIAFVVLVNSGFILAFHGNVGQIPAGALALALLIDNGWICALLVGLAIFFEPKLGPSGLILLGVRGFFLPMAFILSISILIASMIYLFNRQLWGWLVEANITIPKRMAIKRKKDDGFAWPWYTAESFIYIIPWIGLAATSLPYLTYWISPIVYLIILIAGGAVRPNHMIPFAAWIAAAGMKPEYIIVLVLADFLAGGLYLGNIWGRFYKALSIINQEAKEIGIAIKNQPGDLWVNCFHSGVYIYARKPIIYGLNEQAEIRDVAHERRQTWRELIKKNMPTWIVDSPTRGWGFQPIGYNRIIESDNMFLYKKTGV